MTRQHTKPKDKVGRSDRYPSDYGVRDREQKPEQNDSWVPGDKGQGREGYSKGYGGSGGKGAGRSGPEPAARPPEESRGHAGAED